MSDQKTEQKPEHEKRIREASEEGPCLLAMKVWRHRKTMHRRRAGVLGSIKRIGMKEMP